MEASNKATIIQEHMKSLHREVERNAGSQRKLFQLVIAGLAGIVALRKDIGLAEIQAFLPLAPLLAMIVLSFWLAETAFTFRCARWLSASEARLNQLAGIDLVDYETELLRWRNRLFKQNIIVYVIVCVVVSGGYYWLLYRLMSVSALRLQAGFPEVLTILAAVSNAVAVAYVFRIRYELR